MLQLGANVNFYMFFGGTNFGFTAGANDWGTGKYMADITSYDYDAVMDEAGDPNNPKYQYVKDVIEQYFHLSSKPLPQRVPKMSISPITLAPVESILSSAGRRYLGRRHGNSSSNPSVDFKDDNTVENVSEENSERDSSDETDTAGVASILYENPISFEAINQYSGLVLYETDVPATDKIDPTLLKVNGLRDRALVFLDGRYVGILSRENAISSMPLSVGDAKRLQILVENQGRINFNIANDIKGILGNVTLQQLDGQHQVLNNWSIVGYPLTNYAHLKEFVANADDDNVVVPDSGMLLNGPVVFSADFNIPNDNIHDTYLNPSGWGKGIVYINGFHMGRYWPKVGPQVTLYVPKSILRKGINTILLLEYQSVPMDKKINFTSTPQLDGFTNENE